MRFRHAHSGRLLEWRVWFNGDDAPNEGAVESITHKGTRSHAPLPILLRGSTYVGEKKHRATLAQTQRCISEVPGMTQTQDVPSATSQRSQQARPPLPIVVAVLGLAFLDLWIDMFGHSMATLAPATAIEQALTNGRLIFNFSLVLICGLMVAFPSGIERVEKSADAAVPLIALGATLTYAVAPTVFQAPTITLVACIAASAACYAYFEVRLLRELAGIGGLQTVVWTIAASRVLKVILTPMLGSLPHAPQLASIATAPVIIMAALIMLRRTRMASGSSEPQVQKRFQPKAPDIASISVLLVVFPMLNAVARALSTLGFWGGENVIDSVSVFMSMVAALIFAALVVASFSHCSDEQVVGRLMLGLAILMCCLVLFDQDMLEQMGVAGIVSATLSTATELFSDFIIRLTTVVAIWCVSQHPYRLTALTELVMSTLAVIFSIVLRNLSTMTHYIVSASTLAIFIAVLSLLWRMREAALAIPEVEDIEAACARLAEERGLTQRETEVLVLLVQGRSRSYICDALSLSDSTVKTYMSRLYRKLGIHGKQELISLIRT